VELAHLLLQNSAFPLCLLNAGVEVVLPVVLPSSDVVLLPSASLGLDVLTNSADVIDPLQVVCVDQFGIAMFTHPMLSGTPMFHVPPFKVTTPVIRSRKETHFVRLGTGSWDFELSALDYPAID
jgi:hypothetical protein